MTRALLRRAVRSWWIYLVAIDALVACGPMLSAPPPRPARPPVVRPMVSGTIAYRERVALPADAVVAIEVVDVTAGDQAPPLVRASFRTEGRQMPLAFELPIESSRVDRAHAYTLRATITSGGRVLFTTSAPVPVLTQGRPSRVDVILTAGGGT